MCKILKKMFLLTVIFYTILYPGNSYASILASNDNNMPGTPFYFKTSSNYQIINSNSEKEFVFFKDSSNHLNSNNIKLFPNYLSGEKVKQLISFETGWSLIQKNNQIFFVQTNKLAERVFLDFFRITYYCPCNICNGIWGPYDKFGAPLIDGTAAVDPSIIELGTMFSIGDEKNIYIAKDTGSAIIGNHIDIFVNVSHETCLNLGTTIKPVYIYIPCK